MKRLFKVQEKKKVLKSYAGNSVRVWLKRGGPKWRHSGRKVKKQKVSNIQNA